MSGVPTDRDALLAALAGAIAAARADGSTVALALLDVRNFHHINRLSGFAAGDALLAQIHTALQQGGRRRPVVARVGSDEFGVVYTGLAGAELLPVMGNRLVRELGAGMSAGERELHCEVNVGLAAFPQGADSAEDLFLHAEDAMRAARESGQPCVVDDPGSRPSGRQSWRLELELQEALTASQLDLWYQPKLDLQTGRPARPEALLRWENPRKGQVAPARIVPMIESSGRGFDLARWALNSALRQSREWAALGVAVNVSPTILMQADAAELIAAALRIRGIAPESLTIEVSQTGLLPDPEACVRQLKPLRDAGVRVSIDDFGTGNASLLQFRSLSADEIKIDRSFVGELTRSDADRAICEHVIGLAHRFGMTVVAEGVEDQATLARLRGMGCDLVQGYRIARPMPSAALAQWLQDFDAAPFAG